MRFLIQAIDNEKFYILIFLYINVGKKSLSCSLLIRTGGENNENKNR